MPLLLLTFISAKNKFKQENDLYPRIMKRKLILLKILSTLSRYSTLLPYIALNLSKPLFNNLQPTLTKYGTNTPRLSISLGTPRYGGTIFVAETQTYTNKLDNLKTENGSRKWSKRQNKNF